MGKQLLSLFEGGRDVRKHGRDYGRGDGLRGDLILLAVFREQIKEAHHGFVFLNVSGTISSNSPSLPGGPPDKELTMACQETGELFFLTSVPDAPSPRPGR